MPSAVLCAVGLYSLSSVGLKPAKSAAGINPLVSAYSFSAKWQKMYWSGICIEKARWDLILSTVPLTSTVPVSSSREMHMSSVQKVPVYQHKMNHLELYVKQTLTNFKFMYLPLFIHGKPWQCTEPYHMTILQTKICCMAYSKELKRL